MWLWLCNYLNLIRITDLHFNTLLFDVTSCWKMWRVINYVLYVKAWIFYTPTLPPYMSLYEWILYLFILPRENCRQTLQPSKWIFHLMLRRRKCKFTSAFLSKKKIFIFASHIGSFCVGDDDMEGERRRRRKHKQMKTHVEERQGGRERENSHAHYIESILSLKYTSKRKSERDCRKRKKSRKWK